MAALTPISVVSRASDVIAVEVDRDSIVLNPNTGECYGFNKVGSEIWSLIAEPKAVEEICASLRKIYAVDYQTCEAQVLDFFNEFRGAGLMLLHDGSGHSETW